MSNCDKGDKEGKDIEDIDGSLNDMDEARECLSAPDGCKIEDNIGVLHLDGLLSLSNLLSNILDHNNQVGLDDMQQILFEESVIQSDKVGADCWIRREFYK